jgi:hypothetical protein
MRGAAVRVLEDPIPPRHFLATGQDANARSRADGNRCCAVCLGARRIALEGGNTVRLGPSNHAGAGRGVNRTATRDNERIAAWVWRKGWRHCHPPIAAVG